MSSTKAGKKSNHRKRFNMKFHFYADPSHSWLRVPISLVIASGIAGKISCYSYRKNDNCYLEEDCDAPLFFKAYEDMTGEEPDVVSHYTNNRSSIRGYPTFYIFRKA